jgi:hypothetical protein
MFTNIRDTLLTKCLIAFVESIPVRLSGTIVLYFRCYRFFRISYLSLFTCVSSRWHDLSAHHFMLLLVSFDPSHSLSETRL